MQSLVDNAIQLCLYLNNEVLTGDTDVKINVFQMRSTLSTAVNWSSSTTTRLWLSTLTWTSTKRSAGMCDSSFCVCRFALGFASGPDRRLECGLLC